MFPGIICTTWLLEIVQSQQNRCRQFEKAFGIFVCNMHQTVSEWSVRGRSERVLSAWDSYQTNVKLNSIRNSSWSDDTVRLSGSLDHGHEPVLQALHRHTPSFLLHAFHFKVTWGAWTPKRLRFVFVSFCEGEILPLWVSLNLGWVWNHAEDITDGELWRLWRACSCLNSDSID